MEDSTLCSSQPSAKACITLWSSRKWISLGWKMRTPQLMEEPKENESWASHFCQALYPSRASSSYSPWRGCSEESVCSYRVCSCKPSSTPALATVLRGLPSIPSYPNIQGLYNFSKSSVATEGNRFTVHAGWNLPTKEFCYVTTVTEEVATEAVRSWRVQSAADEGS